MKVSTRLGLGAVAALWLNVAFAGSVLAQSPALEKAIATLKAGNAKQAATLLTAEIEASAGTSTDKARALYFRSKAYLATQQPGLAMADAGMALWLKKLSSAEAADAEAIRLQAKALAGVTAVESVAVAKKGPQDVVGTFATAPAPPLAPVTTWTAPSVQREGLRDVAPVAVARVAVLPAPVISAPVSKTVAAPAVAVAIPSIWATRSQSETAPSAVPVKTSPVAMETGSIRVPASVAPAKAIPQPVASVVAQGSPKSPTPISGLAPVAVPAPIPGAAAGVGVAGNRGVATPPVIASEAPAMAAVPTLPALPALPTLPSLGGLGGVLGEASQPERDEMVKAHALQRGYLDRIKRYNREAAANGTAARPDPTE